MNLNHILALALIGFCCCAPAPTPEILKENQASIAQKEEIALPLSAFENEENSLYGYKDAKGNIIIEAQFAMAFTQDFRIYGFVAQKNGQLFAIDTKGNKLYQVFNYDNGPDYPSEGLFRIMKDGKIGYADEKTGQIVIEPKYIIALPFENEFARVSDTNSEKDAYLINKKGEAF